MKLIQMLERLINEHGSAEIRGERLLLLKDELSKVEKDRAELAEKCANLQKEVTDLREQLSKKNITSNFTERLGVLFKRDSTGSYAPTAYCPECKRPLWNTHPKIFPYQCSTTSCGFTINIHEDLQSVVEQLNKENS